MRIKRLSIENVRSFLHRQEIFFHTDISIVIGPNGGGKTNILDTLNFILRRHLFGSKYLAEINDYNQNKRYELRDNENLGNFVIEKHHKGGHLPQRVEIDIQISLNDINNMHMIKNEYQEIKRLSKRNFVNDPWAQVSTWDVDAIHEGQVITYAWNGNSIEFNQTNSCIAFIQYLQLYEIYNMIRAELGKNSLQLSMIYLPVNRTSNSFSSSVTLSSYNDSEQKKSSDTASSRSQPSVISLAIGRLAQQYRNLQEDDNVNAKIKFRESDNIRTMTEILNDLGYSWELITTNRYTNQYDIMLEKQGNSFLVGAASSGEREILNYLFCIYALNVRDTLIIVDEPELHLHPKWQKILLYIFERLANNTGNQFFLASHSSVFITPTSIQYISRVYNEHQNSRIIQIESSSLPNQKHLLSIVNSQNNEKIFFADIVVLVEGISDRLLFERLLDYVLNSKDKESKPNIEIIDVGGKNYFDAYQKILRAFKVRFFVISDFDYIEQIGTPEIKAFFKPNMSKIVKDVILNPKSVDGADFFIALEKSIKNGDINELKEIFDYVSSRRIRVPSSLSSIQRQLINDFIYNQRQSGVFILSRGSIEDYLPISLRKKQLDELINFLNLGSFFDEMRADYRSELIEIVSHFRD
jgi:putative ATP-dependent endonuclease of OLD family